MPPPSDPDRLADLLISFARSRQAPCPACGASLAELSTTSCGACRTPLVLELGLTDSCTRQLVLGAVGLALGFGFNLTLGAIIGVNMLSRPVGVVVLRILPLYIGAPVLGILLLLWVRRRARFRVLSSSRRWRLVIACWVATLLFLAWLATGVILRW